MKNFVFLFFLFTTFSLSSQTISDLRKNIWYNNIEVKVAEVMASENTKMYLSFIEEKYPIFSEERKESFKKTIRRDVYSEFIIGTMYTVEFKKFNKFKFNYKNLKHNSNNTYQYIPAKKQVKLILGNGDLVHVLTVKKWDGTHLLLRGLLQTFDLLPVEPKVSEYDLTKKTYWEQIKSIEKKYDMPFPRLERKDYDY